MISLGSLVNGLVDQYQQGPYAASVSRIAEEMDLPRLFVDVRHSATHEHLPSLHLLRKAAIQGLEWLEMKYWKKQAEKMSHPRDRIRILVQRYFDMRKQRVSG